VVVKGGATFTSSQTASRPPDGGPHTVAVRIGPEGGRIAFLTNPTFLKARNLEHDPRVAISVTRHDQPFAMAEVRGRSPSVSRATRRSP
jgi:hypothetical protein